MSATLSARAQAAHSRYVALKGDVQTLLIRYPAPVAAETIESLARRVAALPRGSDVYVRMTAEQIAMLLKSSLAVASSNLGQAYAMAGADPAVVARNAKKISDLISSADSVITAARRFVDGVNAVDGAVASARRAVGLGVTGGEILAVIAGTLVAIVAASLLVALLGYIAAAVSAHFAAERACAAEAARGTPCTGAQREAFRSAAMADAMQYQPRMPDLPQIGPDLDKLILLAGVAAIGFGMWTVLPAAQAARARYAER